jgi:hypothetical protein
VTLGETTAILERLVGRSAVLSVVLPGREEAAVSWGRVTFEEPLTLNEPFFDKADWIGQQALLRIWFQDGVSVYIGGIRPRFANPS